MWLVGSLARAYSFDYYLRGDGTLATGEAAGRWAARTESAVGS